jgi:hypothetical protein
MQYIFIFFNGLHDFQFTPTSSHLHANRHGTVLESPIRPSATFPTRGREANNLIVLASHASSAL